MDALAISDAHTSETTSEVSPRPNGVEQDKGQQGENKFQKAIAAWRGILRSPSTKTAV